MFDENRFFTDSDNDPWEKRKKGGGKKKAKPKKVKNDFLSIYI